MSSERVVTDTPTGFREHPSLTKHVVCGLCGAVLRAERAQAHRVRHIERGEAEN